MTDIAVPPTARPQVGDPASDDFYLQLHHPRLGRARLAAGLGLFVVLGAVAVVGTSLLTVVAQFWLSGDPETALQGVTPALLLGTNVGLALLWPVAVLVDRVVFGPAPGGVTGRTGRLPWRTMLRIGAGLMPVFALYAVATLWLQPAGRAETPAWTTAAFLAVVLLTTPLQAMGEEVAFRGLLPRIVGGLVGRRGVAVAAALLVPAVLFMLAHGAGDWWLRAYYLTFGLSLGVLAWRTGDIGRGAVVHAANNVAAFVVAFAVGMDTNAMFDRQAGVGGPYVLVPMLFIAAVSAVLLWSARAQRVRRGAGDRWQDRRS